MRGRRRSWEFGIRRIQDGLADWDARHPERPAAPFAVNQIVHRSNARLEADLQVCVDHRVPIYITSLGGAAGGECGGAWERGAGVARCDR